MKPMPNTDYAEYYKRKMQEQFKSQTPPIQPKLQLKQLRPGIQPTHNYNPTHNSREKRINRAILGILIALFIISFIILIIFLPKSNTSTIIISIVGIVILFLVLTLLHRQYEKAIVKAHPAFLIFIIYSLLAINMFLGTKYYSIEWAFLGFIVASVIIYDSKADSRFLILPSLLLLAYIPFLLIGKFNTMAENIAIYVYYFLVCGVVLQVIEHVKQITNTISFDTFSKNALKELDWIKAVIITGVFSISIIIANRFYDWQFLKWTSVYLFAVCLVIYLVSNLKDN